MKFNPENGDLYVANDIGQSVLVFANAANAQGDVAPARHPRAVHAPAQSHGRRARPEEQRGLGLESGQLLGHRVSADGRWRCSPLRMIRSAEESKVGVNFGRTTAVTYDPIRQEILVPN